MIWMVLLVLCSCGTTEKKADLRYATFNLRYDNPDDRPYDWASRRDSVCRFIAGQGIDVVGMQEVLHHQLQDLLKAMPQYAYVGVGREDGRQKGEYAPILYRADRFELQGSHTFWLSQYPDSVGFIGWDGACTRIATWARLKDRQSGKTFVAVNTHMDHVGTEARRRGALLIIDSIARIAAGVPAVLTGDFNVDSHSEAYQTLTTDTFRLLDTRREAAQVLGPQYTFHGFGRTPMERRAEIDFVFVTPGVRVLRSEVVQESDSIRFYLSDHNPVLVDLNF